MKSVHASPVISTNKSCIDDNSFSKFAYLLPVLEKSPNKATPMFENMKMRIRSNWATLTMCALTQDIASVTTSNPLNTLSILRTRKMRIDLTIRTNMLLLSWQRPIMNKTESRLDTIDTPKSNIFDE
jgi:hypothetical protein